MYNSSLALTNSNYIKEQRYNLAHNLDDGADRDE